MKKILLFPGAFNPPHYGHVSTLETALEKERFDEVWIVPSGKRRDKTISLNYEHRRSLSELFVKYLQSITKAPVKLITAELDDTEGRDTTEALELLRSQSNAEIVQLIGLDGYLNIQDELKNSNEKFVVVVNRTGYSESNIIERKNIEVLKGKMQDVSSTQIREMVRNKEETYKKLVPDSIANYITNNELYV